MYLIYSTLCYAIIHLAAVEALGSFHRHVDNDGASKGRKVVIRDKDRSLRGSYHVESKDKSIELIVDDLVEKVKDRLKSELKMITSSHGSIGKQAEDEGNPREDVAVERKKKLQAAKLLQDKYIKPTYLPLSELEAGYELTNDPNTRNTSPKVGIPKIKRKTTTPDTRYLAEVFTAKPPKYLLEYGPPKSLRSPTTSDPKNEIKKKLKTTTEEIETVTDTTLQTTEDTGAFVGFDLVNTNDSYEDYVTPKKDIDYKEPETHTSGYEIVNKGRESKYKNRQKMLNDFERADQEMIKTKKRVNLDEYKIEDNAIYEQDMLGDFDRANDAMMEYEKSGQKVPTKSQQKALDDFYRAKQLMSKIKQLKSMGGENKNYEKFKHPNSLRNFDKPKVVSNIKVPNINDERAIEVRNGQIQMSNIDMEMKPYLEQLQYLENTDNNADSKKETIKNLFQHIKTRNNNQDYGERDGGYEKHVEDREIEMTGPILRARKNVDALVEETQPYILKRRKSFDILSPTNSDTNESYEDDVEDIDVDELLKTISGNDPMKKTKIYLINLAHDKL